MWLVAAAEEAVVEGRDMAFSLSVVRAEGVYAVGTTADEAVEDAGSVR